MASSARVVAVLHVLLGLAVRVSAGSMPGCECMLEGQQLPSEVYTNYPWYRPGLYAQLPAISLYGTHCDSWDGKPDTPFGGYCSLQNNITAAWCQMPWCYVSSTCATRVPSSVFAGSSVAFYSYATCGAGDWHSSLPNGSSSPHDQWGMSLYLLALLNNMTNASTQAQAQVQAQAKGNDEVETSGSRHWPLWLWIVLVVVAVLCCIPLTWGGLKLRSWLAKRRESDEATGLKLEQQLPPDSLPPAQKGSGEVESAAACA